VALPVTTVTETLRPYTLTQTRRTEEEALSLADTVLTKRLNEYLADEGEVVSRELTYEVEGETLVATLRAECTEQIGVFQEIPKE
jgi:similar to stage IV sporulation protein